MNPEQSENSVAIVGMACRFPEARTIDAFWENLKNGVEPLKEFSDQQLALAGVAPEQWRHPDYVRRGMPLGDIDKFDADFFQIPTREAQLLDPQQRLMLECAWEALEHAGYPPRDDPQPVGVYAGCRMSEYQLYNVGKPDLFGLAGDPPASGFQRLLANDKDYLATRISYKLNLTGPSLTVQTACSTSLVAVHLACQGLLNYECDLALAGGASVRVPETAGYQYTEGMIFSPDGHTRSFDAGAQGTLFGSGVGVIALKRLQEAVADGDTIYAVIRGSAVNNDGKHSKSNYTAPSPAGQEQVIAEALAAAEIPADTVSYVEAHGTATPLGDPIEISALTRVFETYTRERGYCAIGSVKSNMGHLVQAAGIAGLIKTSMMLHHGEFVPSLHYENPNPNIDFAHTPFYVGTKHREWPRGRTPRRAGVSAFGFGGTNAHIVLEEAPEIPPREVADAGQPGLIVLSARNSRALQASARKMSDLLQSGDHPPIPDIAYTSHVGRHHFSHRLAIVSDGSKTAATVDALASFADEEPNPVSYGIAEDLSPPKIAFLFTGQGSQYPGMGRDLYDRSSMFRGILDTCSDLLQTHLERPLLEMIFPQPGEPGLLDDTSYAQPVLFALEYALAKTWTAWGITPDAMIGHSLGEYVAACLAGVFSLEDGIKITVARGRLMGELERAGAMGTVYSAPEKTVDIIAAYPDVTIAAYNGPDNTVISGPVDEVKRAIEKLVDKGVTAKMLPGRYAFHSKLIEPALHGFGKILTDIDLHAPSLNVISTATGEPAGAEMAKPDYWIRQTRGAVHFVQAVRWALDAGTTAFLEIGARPTLTGLAKILPTKSEIFWGYSLRPKEADGARMLTTLGEFYVRGAMVDWEAVNEAFDGQPRRVAIPTYPFQRESYWSTLDKVPANPIGLPTRIHPTLGGRIESPLSQHVYSNQIRAAEFSFLRDHVIHGEYTMPATGMVETTHAAAGEYFGSGSEFSIREMSILRPMIFDLEEPQPTQTIVTPKDEGTINVSSYTRPGKTWVQHSSAEISRGVELPRSTVSLDRRKAVCREEHPAAEYYKAMIARGASVGPALQEMRRLWYGEGDQALAFVELGEPHDETGFAMHPGLLDCCIQVGAAAYSRHYTDPNTPPYLPYLWEDIRVYSPFPNRVWSHAQLHPIINDKIRTATLTIYDDDGNLLADIGALHYNRASREAFLRNTENNRLPLQWLIQKDWERLSLESLIPNQHWWIISLGSELAEQTALELARHQQTSTVTTIDKPIAEIEIQQLLKEQLDLNAGVLHGIIYLAGAEIDDRDPVQAQQILTGNALALLQARAALSQTHAGLTLLRTKVVLVTRGSQCTEMELGPLNPAGAPLFGLARTARRENEELALVAADLPPHDGQDLANCLIDCLRVPHAETGVAWRGKQVFAERLRPIAESDPGVRDSYRLQIQRPGVLESLRWQAVQKPHPGPDEILIKVQAAALNFHDVLFALDRIPGELGYDCAGIVTSCGENVTSFRPGDAVLALGENTLSSHVVVHAKQAVLKPIGMIPETAASLPVAFVTTWYGLHDLCKLRPGEWVLIHSAAGGVGLAAVQIAVQAGAGVIGTAHPSKWPLLRKMGVTHLASSRNLDFVDLVRHVTNHKGVDIVVNTLANEFVSRTFDSLRPGGRFIELGVLNVWDEAKAAKERPDVAFHHYRMAVEARKKPSVAGQALNRVVNSIEEGGMKPPPIRVIPADQVSEAFKIMSHSQHVGKLVVSLRPFVEGEMKAPIRSYEATYLITGGLGGLGIQLAEWLIQQGAANLVLLGRRAPNTEIEDQINRLRNMGAEIRTFAVDVADRDQLERLFSTLKREGPALRGIFHAAGVLDDGVLDQQDWFRFEKVFGPKVTGSWLLHELSRDFKLDHFVLFSSTASLWGNPGQSSYAAANAFMDTLAHSRRQLGLPALSVNWGAWGGAAGMASNLSERIEDSRRQRGLRKIEPETGFELLGVLLQRHEVQIGVSNVDWGRFLRRYPAESMPPLFSALQPALSTESGSGPREELHNDFFEKLLKLEKSLQPAAVERHLQQCAGELLGIPSAQIETEVSLQDYGLDSLSALLLRNRVMSDFQNLPVPVARFVSGPSVEQLRDLLLEALSSLDLPAEAGDSNWEEGEI